MSFIIVQSNYPSKSEADKSIKYLLDKKLISSANSFPIKSTSAWLGEIKEVDEIATIFKTRKENWQILKEEIKKMHPFKIPYIAKIEAEANEDYEDWIVKQTNPDKD